MSSLISFTLLLRAAITVYFTGFTFMEDAFPSLLSRINQTHLKTALDSTLSTCTQLDTSRINQWIHLDMID